ncbi:hypothetical protein WJX73_008652 [Symbiochloris irregularis]|uniref:glutamine--fructose-6-phosphate transaminase (isomerizing) n=1 Tax=Symbiochloris irregularis TaxID=706552 RepID=A0AAW1PCI1_9CHLO
MCGIFGYYNFRVRRSRKAILEFLFTGLRRLEYRGYDSAGISIDVDPLPPAESLQDAAPASDVPESNGHALDNGHLSNGHSLNGSLNGDLDQRLTAQGSVPVVLKALGNIAALVTLAHEELCERQVSLDTVLEHHAGIAHTRWATHGVPSAVNSHPHVSDAANEFVVVHNGIITNFQALKDFLIKHGEKFESATDTEVIPKLCKYVYHNLAKTVPFNELIMEVITQLEGAFSLLIKSSHYPGELVATKRGSPLIIGIKNAVTRGRSSWGSMDGSGKRAATGALECFIASDASAVVEHTKQVIVMEDNDLVHLQDGDYQVFNAAAEERRNTVPRVLLTLTMEVSQIMKGGYDHFMQKEIHEQPDSILQTMRGRVRFERTSKHAVDPYKEHRILLGGLTDQVETIRRSRRIMFIACGTSYHSCLAARQTVEELVDVPVALELASDLMDRHCPIFRDDTCVFVSQSGETADTLMALEYAKVRGALLIGVTNTVGSAIARMTHCGVHINAGCEIGVASTKAYTSQMVAITMMALMLSEDSIQRRPLRDAIIEDMGKLPDSIREVLKLDDEMKALAEQLKKEENLLVFGRGYNYATALEAALKVKEVAYMHSEGILAGEMKHGPLALVDENLAIIVVATRDRMYEKMKSVIQQLRARHARLIVLCNPGDPDLETLMSPKCRLIHVPRLADCLQPIINIVPLQLLSYHLTILRGFNVDQPRNLAKSVTITEQ